MAEDQPADEKPQTAKTQKRQKVYRPKKKDGEEEEVDANDDQDQEEQPKEEKKKREKNFVYVNPVEFKETRKFKSKWEEYRKGDWRKQRSNTYVTLDTVIPALPEKLLVAPDEESYKKKLKDIETKISDISKNLENNKAQFDDLLS